MFVKKKEKKQNNIFGFLKNVNIFGKCQKYNFKMEIDNIQRTTNRLLLYILSIIFYFMSN